MKRTSIDYLIFAFLCVGFLLLSGCVATHWKSAEGDELRRISLGGDQSAASVNLKKGTMEGYKSEQAQIAGAVAGEVAKALVKP